MRGNNRWYYYRRTQNNTFFRFGLSVLLNAPRVDRHLRDIDDMFERLYDHPKLGHKRDEPVVGVRSILDGATPDFLFANGSSNQHRACVASAFRHCNALPSIVRSDPFKIENMAQRSHETAHGSQNLYCATPQNVHKQS
jgi:hypothetical protein